MLLLCVLTSLTYSILSVGPNYCIIDHRVKRLGLGVRVTEGDRVSLSGRVRSGSHLDPDTQ